MRIEKAFGPRPKTMSGSQYQPYEHEQQRHDYYHSNVESPVITNPPFPAPLFRNQFYSTLLLPSTTTTTIITSQLRRLPSFPR